MHSALHRPLAAPSSLRQRIGRWAGVALGAAVLAVVFMLYAEPDFVVMMADQVWSCF